MKTPKRHTITAALPYANGPLHLGHLAGVYISADIYARFLRSNGEDVAFICGSDEHGAAITLRAKKENKSPKEIVDEYHFSNKDIFEKLGISFDIYDRTSSKHHHETAQELFLEMDKKGAFVKKESEQYFDEEYQQFLADRYITGQCPKCGYQNAYGDQCEKCGSALNSSELIHPISTLSGKSPQLKSTTHWYLPLDRHEKWLSDWIQKGIYNGEQVHSPENWKNQVVGQCMSWIKAGLQPRAITRDLDWGVSVPVQDGEGKVLYVWFDAPIGYISATKKWANENGKSWEDYWKSKDTNLVHFLAKDNIVFHTIIFPAILSELDGYILPTNVPANEFLNLEGQKLSTSRNWAVWGKDYITEFPNQEDILRYVLCSIAPENKDSDFSWKDFQARNNNELCSIFGNFVNRTLVLTKKYYNRVTPSRNNLLEVDIELLKTIKETPENIAQAIRSFRFRDAQGEAMKLARAGNKYLADTEPWKLIKTDPERVKTIMNISLQITANLAIVFEPFMPKKALELAELLNIVLPRWDQAGKDQLINENHIINEPRILFQKIEDEKIDEQIKKLKNQDQKPNKYPPMKEEITFDEFSKMDLRVGTITAAEKIEKADKLLKLTVDTGIDVRTVVSGIAEHFKPEEVIGQKVSILLNLAPRKIRGVESQGMILMAETEMGELAFVSPTNKEIDAGNTIR
ncbi:MAG: Methionine--tRNA ligase [Crocinitomicaceae bacterium]|nr:MAG: Methionine--tRNA ligase [Crocinitomicaceae bacterium]